MEAKLKNKSIGPKTPKFEKWPPYLRGRSLERSRAPRRPPPSIPTARPPPKSAKSAPKSEESSLHRNPTGKPPIDEPLVAIIRDALVVSC